MTNGEAATWTEGENTVTVTVTNGNNTKTYTVTVTKTTPPNAKLSALTIGSLTLTPTFDGDVTEYTTSTTNATNTITATAAAEGATVSIKNGETTVENGQAATWVDGENTVTVTVTNGNNTKTYTVTVTKTTPPNAKLSALTIGSLTLTPTFDGDVTEYTTNTTNATNTITATAAAEEATVSIKNGETTVENGQAATWVDGENTVTITVTNGSAQKVYTVTVTKS